MCRNLLPLSSRTQKPTILIQTVQISQSTPTWIIVFSFIWLLIILLSCACILTFRHKLKGKSNVVQTGKIPQKYKHQQRGSIDVDDATAENIEITLN